MFRKFLATLMTLALLLIPMGGLAETAEEPIQLHMLYAACGFVLPDVENPIREAICEATGIDIYLEPWYYADENELNTKLNMWAASGELPFDFLLCGGSSTFQISMLNMMGEAGMLKNLEPYILSSEAMTEFCSYTFPKYRAEDGNIYQYPFHLIPAEDMTKTRESGISTRIDWMQEQGITEPQNADEFRAMLEKFKDAYGITPYSTSEGEISKIAINFVGAYGVNYWEKDTEGVYRIQMFNRYDDLTDFAVYMNSLWNDGLMDKESFTQKEEQLIEKMTNGDVAVASDLRHSTQAAINNILWEADESDMFAFIPSFPAEGVTAVNAGVYSWGGNAFVANANVSEEKMAALVKYWDWLFTPEGTKLTAMGIEGEQWAYNEDGKCEYLPEFIATHPTENEMQTFGTWHYQSPACNWYRIDQYAVSKPEYDRADYQYSMAHNNDSVDLNDNLTYAIVAGEEEQMRLPNIEESWNQTIAKAIMASGEEECRAIMADFLKTLETLGYDMICQERTELTAAIEAKVK